ncbi:darcynin family protein [Chondrinema litorale]|uniref:darcynin family protein n=1 Tax=Chondrinema litorale TaxID=2994555 RepID=UPI0025435037|nr:darcynin family protein [Chondrinema litorale]UZR98221.1 hypothetical protein OQ292_29930 [Chondrinema litorale]
MKKSIYLLCILLFTVSAVQSKPIETPKNETVMKYSILVLYNVTNHWLLLKREERGKIFKNEIMPIIQKFEGKLKVRLFDSEAFHAKTSDFMIIECADLKDHYYFMEHLRDTSLFGKPYIQLVDVIIGIEDGFAQFEDEEYKPD